MSQNQERSLKIILASYLSEKSSIGLERNQVVFKVIKDATKQEIKEAVQTLFDKKVKHVRIVNVRAQSRSFRNVAGKKKGWKKAYVTLQADQSTDFAVNAG